MAVFVAVRVGVGTVLVGVDVATVLVRVGVGPVAVDVGSGVFVLVAAGVKVEVGQPPPL